MGADVSEGGMLLMYRRDEHRMSGRYLESTAGGESEMRKKVWPLGPGCGFRGILGKDGTPSCLCNGPRLFLLLG